MSKALQRLEQILDARRGRAGIVVDSRCVTPGSIFLALPGERSDGRDFLAAALAAGAEFVIAEAAGLAERWLDDQRVLPVQGALEALDTQAMRLRSRMRGQVIAFTGSNGKTTAKSICASLLAERFTVTQSEGNRNSTIGLPISMLNRITGKEDFHVLELGMSQPGEIRRLCRIADPDAGCITNVHPAHLQGLGDLDSIAMEKGELFRWLGAKDGLLVVNEDDPLVLAQTQQEWRRSKYSLLRCDVGVDQVLEVTGQDDSARWLLRTGGRNVTLPLPGRAYLDCAWSAAAVALAVGLDPAALASGLVKDPGGTGRMRPLNWGPWRILDDSYNSNPRSAVAALETLVAHKGPGSRIALLGGMEELGSLIEEGHRELGRQAVALGLDRVLLHGQHPGFAFLVQELNAGRLPCDHINSAGGLKAALDAAGEGVLLVKGSRSSGLDRVLAELLNLEDSP